MMGRAAIWRGPKWIAIARGEEEIREGFKPRITRNCTNGGEDERAGMRFGVGRLAGAKNLRWKTRGVGRACWRVGRYWVCRAR